MKHQLLFLLCLGAYENRHMCGDKAGFTSDMRAYPDNEKFWREARQPVPLTDAIYAAIGELGPDDLDVAVDGTFFPPDNDTYPSRWKDIIRGACREIGLKIGPAGKAADFQSGDERLAEKLRNGEVPVAYTAYVNGARQCLLTDRQVRMLAAMSVRFEHDDAPPHERA